MAYEYIVKESEPGRFELVKPRGPKNKDFPWLWIGGIFAVVAFLAWKGK